MSALRKAMIASALALVVLAPSGAEPASAAAAPVASAAAHKAPRCKAPAKRKAPTYTGADVIMGAYVVGRIIGADDVTTDYDERDAVLQLLRTGDYTSRMRPWLGEEDAPMVAAILSLRASGLGPNDL